jgi:hypothetical protein
MALTIWLRMLAWRLAISSGSDSFARDIGEHEGDTSLAEI